MGNFINIKNIINIINEEVKSTLNEAIVLRDDRLKFSTTVDADFWNYEGFSTDYDIEVDKSKVNVMWSINFWVNQQGIENFNVNIDGVDGLFLIRYLDKQSDELIQENQKNVSEYQWNYRFNGDVNMTAGKSLYPTTLNFDFKNNVCVVNF